MEQYSQSEDAIMFDNWPEAPAILEALDTPLKKSVFEAALKRILTVQTVPFVSTTWLQLYVS